MKKPTISKLKKTLDKWFSKYIRQRDENCVTCGRYYDPKKMQAGHFISRRYNILRYDEMNVHAQCYGCNIGRSGAMDEYFIAMERMYGREVVDEMMIKKHQTRKFTVTELQEMIQHYKSLIKLL